MITKPLDEVKDFYPCRMIDGKKMADDMNNSTSLAIHYAFENESASRKPCLAILSVVGDAGSEVYIRQKQKKAEELGIECRVWRFGAGIHPKTLVANIQALNADDSVDGIIMQLPIPGYIKAHTREVLNAICKEKDVDGLCAWNRGMLDSFCYGPGPVFPPCTPIAVLDIIEQNFPDDFAGKNVVIIGRSELVGQPLAKILLLWGATVTVCHTKTKNLREVCRNADILISAAGCPGLVGRSMVKPGAMVIDVGISRDESGRVVGDVVQSEVRAVAGWLTPVPGGVGPMTVARLMRNVMLAWTRKNSEKRAEK